MSPVVCDRDPTAGVSTRELASDAADCFSGGSSACPAASRARLNRFPLYPAAMSGCTGGGIPYCFMRALRAAAVASPGSLPLSLESQADVRPGSGVGATVSALEAFGPALAFSRASRASRARAPLVFRVLTLDCRFPAALAEPLAGWSSLLSSEGAESLPAPSSWFRSSWMEEPAASMSDSTCSLRSPSNASSVIHGATWALALVKKPN
mmetsp:Transcript_23695/g.57526  ORF Transcript_23695/g.57526 Transcript_23695/m.57526 type:complete len:209 (-) Transcript_23695:287-913(-)